MSQNIDRYAWEDSLIDANLAGIISDGVLLFACKLGKPITWQPRNHARSGLYWSNDKAADSLNMSRATFYRRRKELLDLGFGSIERGNFIPTIPESLTSETVSNDNHDEDSLTSETESLTSETESLKFETDSLMQGETHALLDTYTVDSSTVDTCNVQPAAVTSDIATLPLSPTTSGSSFVSEEAHSFGSTVEAAGVSNLRQLQESNRMDEESDNDWLLRRASALDIEVSGADLKYGRALLNRPVWLDDSNGEKIEHWMTADEALDKIEQERADNW